MFFFFADRDPRAPQRKRSTPRRRAQLPSDFSKSLREAVKKQDRHHRVRHEFVITKVKLSGICPIRVAFQVGGQHERRTVVLAGRPGDSLGTSEISVVVPVTKSHPRVPWCGNECVPPLGILSDRRCETHSRHQWRRLLDLGLYARWPRSQKGFARPLAKDRART